MNVTNKYSIIVISAFFMVVLSACSPEIGSDKWCAEIKEKESGDLTANEVADFAKHCIFKGE